ncbi:hypothetical protein C8J56DRAFT_204164 [Mycena floridula]|nr:hypothetical protein C8J56DRAFT_204164 [Mycena floridula]
MGKKFGGQKRLESDCYILALQDFGKSMDAFTHSMKNCMESADKLSRSLRGSSFTSMVSAAAGGAESRSSGNKRKQKRDRDPNAPRRPASAYLLYQMENIDDVKKANSDGTRKEWTMSVAENWANMSDIEKKPWYDKWSKAKGEYDVALMSYNTSKATDLTKKDTETKEVAEEADEEQDGSDEEEDQSDKDKVKKITENDSDSDSDSDSDDSDSEDSEEPDVKKPRPESATTSDAGSESGVVSDDDDESDDSEEDSEEDRPAKKARNT